MSSKYIVYDESIEWNVDKAREFIRYMEKKIPTEISYIFGRSKNKMAVIPVTPQTLDDMKELEKCFQQLVWSLKVDVSVVDFYIGVPFIPIPHDLPLRDVISYCVVTPLKRIELKMNSVNEKNNGN